ncbi:DUF1015 domain-containing protein [Nocardiopsis trehalosi]|uniref:DUF1015 domain-containing protein n=1 Tax=Nocardiopsis trehalosi TaxID=109329 RepID=UPI00082B408E|nr:DUF1015 domain-containing protein [Nocardiopsis trehalosi]
MRTDSDPTESDAEVLELAPLRGLRYATPDARALIDTPGFDLALALAPPYDVVDAAAVADLVGAEPHNAARLTVPPAAESAVLAGELTGPDRYAAAARTLRRWISTGVLVRDPDPVLYVYEQTAPDGTRQRGLIGALRLPAPGGTVVRPHEDVAAAPVDDRVRLMAATRANLEPILLLYRGGAGASRGAATRTTDAVADGADAPLVDTVTGDGVAHRLWAVADPAAQAAVAADLAGRTALIADGHHRYAAYQRLRADAAAPGPWDHGLALLVDSDAWPPHLGAIHRVVRGLDTAAAARAAERVARVKKVSAGDGPDGGLARLRAAAAHGPALLLADASQARYLVDGFDPSALTRAAPGRPPEWRALPTAALEHLLLPLWGAGDERVDLVHDDPAASAAAARPGADTAVLVPALDVADVYAVTARGGLTPRKSTSFGPKPRTGLVIREFATPSRPPRP